MTPTLAFLEGMSDNVIAGILTGSKCVLFTNNPTLTRASVLTDLTQPTFTSYAAIAITWGAKYQNGVGDILRDSQLLEFTPSDTVGLPQTINGYAIYATISMVDTLLLAKYLAAPVNLTTVLDSLKIVATFDAVNQSIYGDEVQVAP